MRIIIDDDRAASSSVGCAFRAPVGHNGLVRLDINVERQQLANWCWAAIAVSVARYYGLDDLTQPDVAGRVLGTPVTSLADTAARRAVDRTTCLGRALRVVGAFSHRTPGKPLFERIRYEINVGRPLAARVGWPAGDGHYLLVCGYRLDGERVLVADPLDGGDPRAHDPGGGRHGHGEYPLVDLPRSYRGGGVWTETTWTDPDGRA